MLQIQIADTLGLSILSQDVVFQLIFVNRHPVFAFVNRVLRAWFARLAFCMCRKGRIVCATISAGLIEDEFQILSKQLEEPWCVRTVFWCDVALNGALGWAGSSLFYFLCLANSCVLRVSTVVPQFVDYESRTWKQSNSVESWWNVRPGPRCCALAPFASPVWPPTLWVPRRRLGPVRTRSPWTLVAVANMISATWIWVAAMKRLWHIDSPKWGFQVKIHFI